MSDLSEVDIEVAGGALKADIAALLPSPNDTTLAQEIDALGIATTSTTLANMLTPPTALIYFPLNDPATTNRTQGLTVANLKGGTSSACYQLATGVMLGATPNVRGDQSSTCAIFSKDGRPVIELVAAGADTTGGTGLTAIAVLTPMHSRSGAAALQHIQGKRATDTISAGWTFGVYWTGTKLVAAAKFQGAGAACNALAVGSTDLVNFKPVHLALGKAASKAASSIQLYVNGQPETMTIVSDTLLATSTASISGTTMTVSAKGAGEHAIGQTLSGSGVTGGTTITGGAHPSWTVSASQTVASTTITGQDTAANSGTYSVGGLGGTRTTNNNTATDTNLGLNGALSENAFFASLLSTKVIAALANASAPGWIQPKTPGATPVPVLLYTDVTSDVDDMTLVLLMTALHKRGEIALKGVIVTQCSTYGAPFVELLLASMGMGDVPIAAYQGSGRVTPSAWAAATCAAFGVTKTRTTGGYLDPLTLGRTVLANNTNVQIIEGGPPHEISTLLNSPADSISPLTGSQLILAKSRAPLCIMGGYTSSASVEFNFGSAPAAAANVFSNWPTAIVSSPFETNLYIAVPGNPDINPAKNAIKAYDSSGYGAGYDPLTALYAIRGAQTYFYLSKVNQTNTVNSSTGANTWSATAGTHSLLALTASNGAGLTGAEAAQSVMHQLVSEAVMSMRWPV